MRLDRLHEYLTVTIATTAGLALSIYLGQLAGNGRYSQIGYFAAIAAAVVISITTRQRIWMFIPLTWALTASSYLIPLPFSVREVCVLLSFGTFLVLTAFKMVQKRPDLTRCDFFLGLNLLYLATAWARNPVGVSALGTDLVGGRPYYLVIINVMGYWVLSRATISPRQARIIPIFILFSTVVIGVLSLISYRFPSTTPILSHIYSGVEQSAYGAEEEYAKSGYSAEGGLSSRISSLSLFGMVAIAFLCSRHSAVDLFNPLYFKRFVFFAVAWLGVFYSGHRSAVISSLAAMAVMTYFRRGLLDVTKLLILFAAAFLMITVASAIGVTLPVVAQRSLTFLPGQWDAEAVRGAKDSEEWRYEMWRMVLSGNRYIKNKVLGDGFGVSQKDLNEVASAREAGIDISQEGQLIVGGFHNGPLSTIRFVGVVGLILFYAWMFYLAPFSIRLIRQSQNTPYFSLTLFFASGSLIQPFFYTFIVGGFDGALPELILQTGILKLLAHSLSVYKAPAEAPPPARRFIPVSRPAARFGRATA